MPTCKHGKLKSPVGRRRCKKAPKGATRKHRAAVARNIASLDWR